MKVLKFGGTSVGTPQSLRNVKYILESVDQPAIVVVSALGGLTDKLIATANMAAANNQEYELNFCQIVERHHDVITEVVAQENRQKLTEDVDRLLAELKRVYDGVYLIQDLPAKTLDLIVSFGERMSSLIVAAMMNVERYDSTQFIKTEKWFDKNIADADLTTDLIRQTFKDFKQGIAIVPGFISTDRDSSEITNLGRGGSDFTAALIAAALDASILEIWTDVDGFMTADPRIINDARVLKDMSFVESMALCSYGAKVIYPPTIYPVFHKNIPIKILNTFNPEAPGTLITDRSDSEYDIKGVTAVKDAALISINGNTAENVASINTRTYNAMARNGISVYMVMQPGDNPTFSFALKQSDASRAYDILKAEFAPELSGDGLESILVDSPKAIIAVVGENIKNIKGVSARITNTLQRNDIEVYAFSSSTSDTSMLVVVNEKDCNEALCALHSLFF